MKKILINTILIFIVIFSANNISLLSTSNNNSELKTFPIATENYKQVYIQVPQKNNEENFRVELFVGKYEFVDCNSHFLLGKIEEETLEGFGYVYYKVESDGNIASTLMACPDNKKTKKFIYMPPLLVKYNSKLPIVVYIPKNLELKYRIWKADKKIQNAK